MLLFYIMNVINKKTIFIILALLFLLLSILFLDNNCEGFKNITSESNPYSVDNIILNQYPNKSNRKLSSNNSEYSYLNYPIFGSSYSQYTNNIRYWENPDNGTCSRSEFCGGFYDNKKIDIPKTPNLIPFSSSTVRVNFYGSHKLHCPSIVN